MDKLQYVYTKRRLDFGRQTLFTDRMTEVDVNLPHSHEMAKQFISKNPANASTGMVEYLSEHVANTTYVELETVGVNHTEGGWPKDINLHDLDMTTRYRKKAEKDDLFVHQLSRISQEMEHCILQTSAIDIYEHYFDENCPTHQQPPLSFAKVTNMFRDQSSTPRPVAQIVWHPDGPEKFAVAHCILNFQTHQPSTSLDCYVWRTDDLLSPDMVLSPFTPVLSLRYSPKDVGILAGGQYNGQVVIWDLRKGSRPIDKTVLPESHRDPVYDVTWVQSKVGTEFFSTSTDGQVIWWDTRNLSEATDRMFLDATRKNDEKAAEGGTCLEYDVTVPTKFMVGTEQGSVFMCTRKAKSPGEKVATVYPKAHVGPIYSLKRNPVYTKFFLTVGDWTAKVWTEECKDSPIMWTPYGSRYLTDGCWSPVRSSVFFTTRMDGSLDIWDLIYRQKSAEYTIKLSDSPLQCVAAQEQGQLMCVGTQCGRIIVLKLSEGLSLADKYGKQILNAMLERETKREKILEGREREKKLAQKQKAEEAEEKKPVAQTSLAETIEETTKAFFEEVEKERERLDKETKRIAAETEKRERASESRRSYQKVPPPAVTVMGGEVKPKEHFKIEEEDSDRFGKTASHPSSPAPPLEEEEGGPGAEKPEQPGAETESKTDAAHPQTDATGEGEKPGEEKPPTESAQPQTDATVEGEKPGEDKPPAESEHPPTDATGEGEKPGEDQPPAESEHPQTDATGEGEKPGEDQPPAESEHPPAEDPKPTEEETPADIPEVVEEVIEETSAIDESSGQPPAEEQGEEKEKIEVPTVNLEAPSDQSINKEQKTDE